MQLSNSSFSGKLSYADENRNGRFALQRKKWLNKLELFETSVCIRALPPMFLKSAAVVTIQMKPLVAQINRLHVLKLANVYPPLRPSRKRPFEHEEQSKTESPQSVDKKRLRMADVPTAESSDSASFLNKIQNNGEVTCDPGQKTVRLGLIRQRLAALDSRTLYIRKLPRNTTLDHIKVLCPTSITARIQSKKFANRRKHAFVEFKSEEVARAALKAISGKLVADRPIGVELCSERGLSRRTSTDEIGQTDSSHLHWKAPQQRQLQEFSTTVLHVSCIPRSATADEIRDLFPAAVSFDIIMNPKQKGIGSCRVTFKTEKDALDAFISQHNTLVRDCPIVVNFAFKKHLKHRLSGNQPLPDTSGPQQSVPANKLDNKSISSQPIKLDRSVTKPKSPIPKHLPAQQINLTKNKQKLVQRNAKDEQLKTKSKKSKKKGQDKPQPVFEQLIEPVVHIPLGKQKEKHNKSKKTHKKPSVLVNLPLEKDTYSKKQKEKLKKVK
ncbi:hypothetical protein EG68_01251 [Paragonimus skrjabini miyazakii]|uniref:RRM domain-containing protein n=1 Tax=Paragonimus skrjabini miyazakii TaxID=59628 RepID=A0A8S9Z393_9TREM|nr:hypothetical protein EG68_01251 [Paragonimus skrjabini miyazakii]